MLGLTSEEMSTFLEPSFSEIDQSETKVKAYFAKKFKSRAEKMWNFYKNKRAHFSPYTQLVDGSTEWYFRAPFKKFAKKLSTLKPVYEYTFKVQSEMPHIYSGHCLDLPFIFGNWGEWKDTGPNQDIAPMLKGMGLSENERISQIYRKSILNFIKTGKVNTRSSSQIEFKFLSKR